MPRQGPVPPCVIGYLLAYASPCPAYQLASQRQHRSLAGPRSPALRREKATWSKFLMAYLKDFLLTPFSGRGTPACQPPPSHSMSPILEGSEARAEYCLPATSRPPASLVHAALAVPHNRCAARPAPSTPMTWVSPPLGTKEGKKNILSTTTRTATMQ